MRISILQRCIKHGVFHHKKRLISYHLNPRQLRRHSTQSNDVLILSEEVESAVHSGKPLVALETTIITHGMPYPDNLSTALDVEDIVRKGGAVPATIGILDGRIHVGLNKEQLEFLADPKTASVKTSRRDLPFVLSQELNGGTTVSGTMVVANMAGIPIFVTGGIGGVHRGAESSMDISADLTELARTPVTVISAGIKSILDIGRTLEYLETEGVCVSAFGTSRDFPAFFTRTSGYTAPYNCKTAHEAAEMIYARERIELQTGTLIAVPIPEVYDVLGQEIETVIQSVIKEAVTKNIQGKEITPFILQRVNELTHGQSLKANIELIKNNAAVGTEISVELNKLQHTDRQTTTTKSSSKQTVQVERGQRFIPPKNKQVCVVGGSIVDFTARMSSADFKMNGGTYPGHVTQSFGGVGRNIADGLTRLGVDTLFISAIGNDSHRTAYEAHCSHMNLDAVTRLPNQSTATYCAMLKENGELMFGIGDMDIHAEITPQYISQFEDKIKTSSLVCIDGNISVDSIEYVCLLCARNSIPVLFEPTDINKATKPFLKLHDRPITYASPNFNELKMMASYFLSRDLDVTGIYLPFKYTVGQHYSPLFPFTGTRLLERSGKNGVQGDVIMDHYPATSGDQQHTDIVSVSGAGDCLVAAFVAKLLDGEDMDYCIRAGLLAGQVSLKSSQAVPSTLTPDVMSREMINQQMNVRPRSLTFC
ncbi:uncharacterized protein LOC132730522 [Ruditapes philippinarum]|uniref:uncharacterized protein LOC132730522 n=1 Tax=Ruditapes philippinarum TaxID=129788 RepID=UPI00295BA488|nr:uncharacterized protein LOC132730522 [Ruditapes philippinarum]